MEKYYYVSDSDTLCSIYVLILLFFTILQASHLQILPSYDQIVFHVFLLF